jgi:hypothetical protein
MGEHFRIESTTADSRFVIDVDVPTWKAKRDSQGRELWEFEFAELDETPQSGQQGTKVTVDTLRDDVAGELGSKTFETSLLRLMEAAHEQSVHHKLEIMVNQHAVADRSSVLLEGHGIKPIKSERTFDVSDRVSGHRSTVSATIYAGVAESSASASGWYVICNGRQILQADKSATTGWDSVVDDLVIPKAHGQFARFRGYIFFESDNAAALPWNTMKNAVDPESPVYQAALIEMQLAMRKVIDFLNALDAENETGDTVLQEAIKHATPKPLRQLTTSSTFVYPKPGTTKSVFTRISFTRPNEEVDFARTFFGVTAAKAVGERVFEYFLERENV